MGYSDKIGLAYAGWDSSRSYLDSALQNAEIDKSSLQSAASLAHGAAGSVYSAISSVNSAIQQIANFKYATQQYVESVGYFDNDFANTFVFSEQIIEKIIQSMEGLNDVGVDGGIMLSEVIKALKSGCEIIEKDGYYIIKGYKIDRQGMKMVEDIAGTRYKVGSVKFNASGISNFLPQGARSPDAMFEQFKNNLPKSFSKQFSGFWKDTFAITKNDSLLEKFGKVFSYALIAVDVGVGVMDNIDAGETKATKYAADAIVDTTFGLADMALATGCAKVGAAIGTAIPIPVVGTVVGAVAGFAIGYGASKLFGYITDEIDINGRTIKDWASYGLEKGLDAVADGVEWAGNKITEGLESAKEAVGGFFSGVGSAISSVFA